MVRLVFTDLGLSPIDLGGVLPERFSPHLHPSPVEGGRISSRCFQLRRHSLACLLIFNANRESFGSFMKELHLAAGALDLRKEISGAPFLDLNPLPIQLGRVSFGSLYRQLYFLFPKIYPIIAWAPLAHLEFK